MDASDRDTFEHWMRAAAQALGIVVEPRQVDLMYRHLNLVLLANEDFNLTRITDPAEAAVKLAGDSLAILPWASRHFAPRSPPASPPVLSPQPSALSPAVSVRVLDMGTGSGYPSIPVATCRPHWTVTAIDPSGKKIRFVARAAAELGLHNLMAEQIQAREWHGKVALFDLVITRALGDLAACIREGARLLAPAGRIVSYHAEEVTPQEAKAAAQMLKRYKLQQVDSFEYTLPAPKKSVTRRLIVIGKQAAA